MVRIRWAKSDMPNKNFTEADSQGEKYFTVPENQLIEYPGFVYHCHILPHEDNEMMRPIMMQPHRYPPGFNTTNTWQQMMIAKNNKNCPKINATDDLRRA